jgi:hypothetical protein
VIQQDTPQGVDPQADTPTATDETPKKTEIKRVALKEQGARLPLGIINTDGTYTKDIAVRRWRMAEERELGELRDKNRDANVAQFVGMVLATMCTQLGRHKFEELKQEERRIHISQMFMGDVFYAYVWLRLQTLGSELHLNLRCPNCGFRFPLVADLETIEVDGCDTLEECMWEYKLKESFEIRGKEVTDLLMGPARWTSLESMQGVGGLNTGAAKASVILGSIHGIANWKDKDGKPMQVALAESELDEMGKRDIEAITNRVDEHAVGPNMSVEGSCQRCRYQYKLAIDWGYDSFFGDSSP